MCPRREYPIEKGVHRRRPIAPRAHDEHAPPNLRHSEVSRIEYGYRNSIRVIAGAIAESHDEVTGIILVLAGKKPRCVRR